MIDENTAPNVRRIFEMRAQGYSKPQIVKVLNADNIITPSTIIVAASDEVVHMYILPMIQICYQWNTTKERCAMHRSLTLFD
ncbi:MAG: recombinase family protein [Oscillospiraceae bacterium]|nr:recombinase family protein [Oscillospiraceae bacterium]